MRGINFVLVPVHWVFSTHLRTIVDQAIVYFVDFRLVFDWFSVGFTLVFDWFSIGFRLV